ncbi:MAG: NADH-quinone oxidoreductase subunit, partial [Pseudonocardiales bacterium]|nr:NADH-quinone oxidoreductase subunit [Pseudonocardiales bacterium]
MTTAHGIQSAAWLLIALPLLGSVILLLGGRRTNRWGPLLACAMTGAAFVYGLIAFFDLR